MSVILWASWSESVCTHPMNTSRTASIARPITARIGRVTIEATALTSAPHTAHLTPVRPRPRSTSRITCPRATVNVIGTARANTLPAHVNM